MAWLVLALNPATKSIGLNMGQTNLNLTFRAPPEQLSPNFQTRTFPNSVTQGQWPHDTLTVPIGGGAAAAPVGYAT